MSTVRYIHVIVDDEDIIEEVTDLIVDIRDHYGDVSRIYIKYEDIEE